MASKEDLDRVEQSLRAQAEIIDRVAALPESMVTHQERDPEAGNRIRRFADGFRENLTTSELDALVAMPEPQLGVFATTFGMGLKPPSGNRWMRAPLIEPAKEE